MHLNVNAEAKTADGVRYTTASASWLAVFETSGCG